MSTAVATAIPAVQVKKAGFLVSPMYDTVFFITSPLLAVAIGLAISQTVLTMGSFRLSSTYEAAPATFFLGSFTMAHLFIVFFRSHGNKDIFQTHPYRFTIVPVALFVAMTASEWIQVAVAVLATFWDVYHSSLQTFGLGRIYDRLAGNSPTEGRRLDMILNVLLYAGPIVAGVSLMPHVNDFYTFRHVGSLLFEKVPGRIEAIHPWLAIGIIGFGVPFIGYYILRYAAMARAGYRVSPQKVVLLASTAACSIYAWTFNPFGQAFFIMNFFHAFQYFALVWHIEKKNITGLFRLSALGSAKIIALVLFIGIAASYGVFAEVIARSGMLLSISLVVSIMHFWYDGFIWSVRKRQV